MGHIHPAMFSQWAALHFNFHRKGLFPEKRKKIKFSLFLKQMIKYMVFDYGNDWGTFVIKLPWINSSSVARLMRNNASYNPPDEEPCLERLTWWRAMSQVANVFRSHVLCSLPKEKQCIVRPAWCGLMRRAAHLMRSHVLCGPPNEGSYLRQTCWGAVSHVAGQKRSHVPGLRSDICRCLPPDTTWHKVKCPKAD